MPTDDTDAPQDGKKLLNATRPFAAESRIKSWWYLGSTLVVLGAVLALAAVLPWWPLRLAASIAGAYLFYAQHTLEGLHIFPAEEWTYFKGALESSSYMKLGPIRKWFTGNIGYHHVHHLNPHIHFYRLPAAMMAIPELQHPAVTSLRPRDILACFRANLWETRSQQMVSYREARSRQ